MEILESKDDFKTLTKKVQDNVKYALKVYFRFIKKDEKTIVDSVRSSAQDGNVKR